MCIVMDFRSGKLVLTGSIHPNDYVIDIYDMYYHKNMSLDKIARHYKDEMDIEPIEDIINALKDKNDAQTLAIAKFSSLGEICIDFTTFKQDLGKYIILDDSVNYTLKNGKSFVFDKLTFDLDTSLVSVFLNDSKIEEFDLDYMIDNFKSSQAPE